jgi:threonine dehydrogenase-like Zn-dependent dehydrogenase
METLLFRDYNEVVVEEVPRPTPEGDEVLIEVNRVQLSVTECNLYQGADIAHSDQVRRRLEDGPARLFGHEFCGTIVETGEDVADFEVGDRIYAPGKTPCEECAYCTSGYENYCPNKTQIGYDTPGALSEYFVLPEGPLCKLPDEVSDAEGAAMQPFESTVRSVATAGFTPGSVIAVVGTGVMGYQCAQLAKLFGGDRVYAIDIDQEKLDIAEERGLIPINAMEENAAEVIREDTGGIGADYALAASKSTVRRGTIRSPRR